MYHKHNEKQPLLTLVRREVAASLGPLGTYHGSALGNGTPVCVRNAFALPVTQNNYMQMVDIAYQSTESTTTEKTLNAMKFVILKE